MNLILDLGLIFLMAFLFEEFAKRIKLPTVTSYVVLGILVGPYVLNLLSQNIYDASHILSEVVLGLVAFSIAQEFSIKRLRFLGKPAFYISIFAAIIPWLLITFVLSTIFRLDFVFALLLGSVAAATAPAATVSLVRDTQAKGKFTNTLLGVVAIDDAWGLLILAFSIGIAKSLIWQKGTSILFSTLGISFLQIIGALILGVILGYLTLYLLHFAKIHVKRLICLLGFLLLAIGASLFLNLATFITCMAMGTFIVNRVKIEESKNFFSLLRDVDEPLLVLFFILAGASLKFHYLWGMSLVGAAYIALRVIGKMVGSALGAHLAGENKKFGLYMGLALLPTAGVAMGAALLIKTLFPSIGEKIFALMLASVVIFELIGPVLAKYSLVRMGETSK